MRTAAALTCLAHLALSPTQAFADEDPGHPGAAHRSENNGTDPTRVSRTVQVKYEYLALRDGFTSSTLRLLYTQPLGSGFSAVFKLPVTRVDVFGNDGAGLGDVSVQVGMVFGLPREGGNVVQAEVFFDTATRPELGAGNSVLKATYIRAFFLQSGAILAPPLCRVSACWAGATGPRST